MLGQGAVAAVGVSALPLLFMNPIVFIQLIDVFQFIKYIQFIDIDYPNLLDEFFALFEPFDFNIIPNLIPDYLGTMDSPNKFYSRGFQSIYLKESQDYLISLVILLVTYSFVKIIQRVFRSVEE